MYIVMEYVDGVPIDKFPASPDRKLEMFRDVCGAVEWAHQNLIVHRDIKPSNILVDREGKPKLLDFGAAKLMGEEAMAQTGFAMITPGYSSPEQLRGEAGHHAERRVFAGRGALRAGGRREGLRRGSGRPAERRRR